MTPAVVLLERLGVAHQVLAYEHVPASTNYGSEAVELLGLDPATVFKTLIAEVSGVGLVVAIVPVPCTLNMKQLARAVGGKKAVLADPSAAERATGYVLGGISPLGQKRVLPKVLDQSAESFDSIHVSGGRRGLEIRLSPSDLREHAGATSAAIAEWRE